MSLQEYQFERCWKTFIDLKEDGLHYSHYQLAEYTDIKDPLIWREFLLDPRTADYISSEMNLIRGAAINYMVQNAPDSNSVGQSQLINALQKIDEQSVKKEGPVFIYSYVPLDDNQMNAENVRHLETPGFKKLDNNTYILESEDDNEH